MSKDIELLEAPAPGEGAAATGEAPSTAPSRPGPVGGGQQGDDEEHLALVPGEAETLLRWHRELVRKKWI